MRRLLLIFLAIIATAVGTKAQRTSTSINIIAGYRSVNSVKMLLAKFKGKPVFVDMWASWCEPCKEEFKYSKALYTELKKRHIEMIYVSIDKDTTDVAWKSDIMAFSLSGNYIKANKALRDDLTTMIWGGIDAFSIPNYLLFDNKGNLVLKSTLMPDTGIALLNQVDETLAEKHSSNQ